MTDINFTSTAAFDRKFFWKRGGSVRYLVVRLQAGRDGRGRPVERTPLNIALALDASGSMAGDKLVAAKAAALGLADRLTERDRLTLVSFASNVQVHLDAVPVNSDNAVRIRSEISRIGTRGCTDLAAGWFTGVACAERALDGNPQMTPRVIILSDGHANAGIDDPHELREHAHELRIRGVLTSALGIGDGYDEQLLRGVAESGGGRLHDAELTGEISSVLLGELDDIFSTVVENAHVTLTLPSGVRAEVLGMGNTERRDDRLVVNFGPLQADVERTAVVKVTCPRRRKNDEVDFEIAASGRTVEDRSTVTAEAMRAKLVSVDGKSNSAQARDTEVAEVVARTWSAHVVATAARLNRDGAFRQAEAFVTGELHHFRRYAEGLRHGREWVRELELLAERVVFHLSPRVRKEMAFQSSLAVERRTDHRGAMKASWSARMERGD